MKLILGLLVTSIAGVTVAETSLWYDKPARNWETEALPIGNGRLGAMLFGEPSRERIQFNEESLWLGDEKDTGAYQAFGDVIIDFDSQGGISAAECASGQTSPDAESVGASIDGQTDTKWCMEHHGQPAIWIGHGSAEMVVSSYAFTSANDMPDRDPRTWTLEGSPDLKSWTLLDQRSNEPLFAERHQRKEYTFVNGERFEHYRFTFYGYGSQTHFQVAEIEVGKQPKPSVTAYRRELDLDRATHTVTYQREGVNYRRESFASFPAKVLVFRYSADKASALTGTVSLTDMHKGTVRAVGKARAQAGEHDGNLIGGCRQSDAHLRGSVRYLIRSLCQKN